ncbi:putative succinate-semialdehyde dehydrogenase [NADP(+)] 2 [Candidatus Phycosocius bacilliformis]|uniref:Putative succinate-semialdehyde dehydrogenase [NADP(+)] 2 n=1 Tax=Candidatus Phycosocius bacilliformis TaxID=1445552 RepID=A0A2P2EA06_9PROT|nr:aldehyde dehydrogenase family protein [Candidatus Phycosocius bacilliformis]GBF57895.1 putative succinate-semialdehyde dehydrogenase [NADP(+)] 2 [Candidatus Phycosocius bacilliformis]
MSTRLLDVKNPRTGQVDAQLEVADADIVQAKAAKARAAQAGWEALGLEGRAKVLLDLKAALAAHLDAIHAALAHDTGRGKIARREIEGAIASLGGWAAQAPHLLPQGWSEGRSDPRMAHAPQWVPYRLVGVISPWNFPLTLAMIDTIPALLAGCSVIIKPSEVTPRFVAPLATAIGDVPALQDVLQLVLGDGETGMALIDAVDAICFTGSVATGRKVAVQAANRLIPAFLELGGKDPLIITETADLDRAVTAALRGSVLSTGQACQSIERIYVARPLYQDFVDRLVVSAKAARLNQPDRGQGEIGPMIFGRQAGVIAAQLQDAVAKGATILTGGVVEHHLGGDWIAPTVVVNVDHSMALMQEETFGPVMPVMAFDSVDEAIALANDSDFGLSAGVIAGSLAEAEAIGRRIDAGAISLNDAALTSQFYEAEKHSFKQSGLGGSRMGPAGFQRFCRRKALIANRGDVTPLSAYAEEA